MATSNFGEKPLYKYLSIDLLSLVASQTIFHPVIPWFLPLAFRALSFGYHHPPFYLSAAYAAVITIFFFLSRLNQILAYGPSEPAPITAVIITGGSSGLGLLLAQIYSMRGTPVAILDVNPPADPIPNTSYHHCDVSSPSSLVEARAAVEDAFDGEPVSVLINNAATLCAKSLQDLTAADIKSSFATNVLSHYGTIREFLPGMQKHGNGGYIVTVSSVLATLPAAGCGVYAPTKAAVSALHHVLTAELRAQNSNIKTLLVSQGQMSTPLFNQVKTPSSFWAPVVEPVDVAREIVAAIDEGRCGEIAMPFYARWAPIFWVLPVAIREFARRWSGMDIAMEDFRRKSKSDA